MAEEKVFLGDLLVKEKTITAEELKLALERQKKTGDLLGDTLIKMNLISEDALVQFLSSHLGIEYVDLAPLNITPELIKLVPDDLARRFGVIPVKEERNKLILAMRNPQDTFAIDELRRKLGKDIEARITTSFNINFALEKYYGEKAELKGIITAEKEKEAGKPEPKISEALQDAAELSDDASAIKFLNQLLVDAVRDKASDIHIEPARNAVYVRFRIDGVMKDIVSPLRNMHESLVSRIKVMCNLDIAEKRIPQDGKFQKAVENAEIDVRVSTFPTICGEKVVMRILNRSSLSLKMQDLGLEGGNLAKFDALIRRPYGIIFVTGPTGSGKTTTLYSALETIKSREKNIITIEDPVEYELQGISQSQINVRAGLTFSTLLRSTMRQDPDIILVGETRDMETAEVAIRAALTGHLVFSTLHTNDAPSSITRLIDMGVEPFLVSTSVIGVIAQRLVRTICPKCKQKAAIKPELLEKIGAPANASFYIGKGCDSCYGSGYKGRIGIFEILPVDDEIRELITKRASCVDLRKSACQKGMESLRQQGIKKASEGVTTLDEVLRITEPD